MKAVNAGLQAVMIMAASFTAAHAQNADEILQKHIEAMGGTENWNKIKTMKMTGAMNVSGMSINVAQTVKQNVGMRMDITAQGISGYTIITPKAGWYFQPGMPDPMALPADQLKMAQDKLNVKSGMLIDRSAITKADYLGKDTIDNVPCYKLSVKTTDGNTQTDYIEQSTYYLRRTDAKVKVEEQEQEVTVTFSDYKKQPEGIVMPMTMSTSQGDIAFKSIEINKPVDEKIFALDAKKK